MAAMGIGEALHGSRAWAAALALLALAGALRASAAPADDHPELAERIRALQAEAQSLADQADPPLRRLKALSARYATEDPAALAAQAAEARRQLGPVAERLLELKKEFMNTKLLLLAEGSASEVRAMGRGADDGGRSRRIAGAGAIESFDHSVRRLLTEIERCGEEEVAAAARGRERLTLERDSRRGQALLALAAAVAVGAFLAWRRRGG